MTPLGAKQFQLKRFGPASIDPANGEVIRGALSLSTILASVQPLDGWELERLDAGMRAKVTLKAYTRCCLQTAEGLGLANRRHQPDRLVVDGFDFQVESIERQTGVIPHYKALLVRCDEVTT